jgi:hypothetical protein
VHDEAEDVLGDVHPHDVILEKREDGHGARLSWSQQRLLKVCREACAAAD